MDWLPQWLLINGGGFALIFVLIRVLSRRSQRQTEQLADRLTPEASARGWQVSTELSSDNLRVIRWRGRDFDIQWLGEDLFRKRGQGTNRHVMEVTRWQTQDRRGPAGAIFLMGLPDGTELPKAQAVEGFFQSLAARAAFFALDRGIDMYFGAEIGQEIDASSLQRVEQVEPLVNGYAVFAEHTQQAAEVIRSGVDRAIATAIEGGPESLRGERRPWILIWKRGVVIARVGPTRSAAELEPFVKAGVAITRAIS